MSTAAPARAGPGGRLHARRLVRLALTILAIGAASYLLGWDISAWFGELWDTLTGISIGYVVAGIALTTLQTIATAAAWYWILRAAYGKEDVGRKAILASYATAVALNGILPANLGTVVSLLMFVAVIPAATVSGVLGGFVVQKIFFTVAGAAVYLYLFLSVGGSFDIKFSWVHAHPWATVAIAAGAVGLVLVLVRIFRPRLKKLWKQAKDGGRILASPRAYMLRVALPSFVGWCASLGVIAVFLAAYGIPVGLHTIMAIVGGNSIANTASLTPGGVGVNQAFNVASLRDVTDTTTATAYSVGQQLVTTAWNQVFAIAMLIWAFGWSGGKVLVADSYTGARERTADERAKRKAKKDASRAN
jgi:uncharacterized membrane protein YbhN (UPF0104 family)